MILTCLSPWGAVEGIIDVEAEWATQVLEHDVFGFQIAVPDAASVGRGERVAELLHDRGDVRKSHGPVAEQGAQSHSVYELQNHEWRTIRRFAGIENADHSGMVDTGQRFYFLGEFPVEPVVIGGVFFQQNLDDHGPGVQTEVVGQVDDAEAAAAQLGLDHVSTFELKARRDEAPPK